MSDRVRLDIRGIAERYGVTEAAVRQWIGRAPIHKGEGGRRFAWSDELDAWRLGQGRSTPDQDDRPASLTEEKIRLARAQADNMELRNAIARGELLQASKVREAASALFGAAGARLRQIGVRIAPALAVEDSIARCRDLVEQAVEDAISELRELANIVGDAGSAGGIDGGIDSTPPANPKRVGRSASPSVTRGVV